MSITGELLHLFGFEQEHSPPARPEDMTTCPAVMV
jgi:hypothetical protein